MQSFDTLARSRRSLRRYEARPIPHDLVRHLLELATWAPSAHNRQPWRFAVLDAAVKKEQLALAMGARLRADLEADGVPEDIIAKDTGRSYERITNAPLVLCLCMSMADMDTYPDPIRTKHERTMAIQSTAMAGQNLLLAAHAAGLGACWMCAPLFCQDVVRDTLNLPEDWEAQALITLGYPAQSRNREREALESRVLWR